MRIYSKASPMFKNPDKNIRPDDKNKLFRCTPGFQTVPDWARNDKTFRSSVDAGIIQVIEVPSQVTVPGAPKLTKAEKKALAESIAQDIELINACATAEDLASITGSLANADNAEIVEAIAEKTAALEKG